MDKENQDPNVDFNEDFDLDDMPELTDCSETSEQVQKEPYLVLSNKPSVLCRPYFEAPHVHMCFCNTYLYFAAWIEWQVGFNLGPQTEQLGGVHRQNVYRISDLPAFTVVRHSSDSESKADGLRDWILNSNFWL